MSSIVLCFLKFLTDLADLGDCPQPDFAHPEIEFMIIALLGVISEYNDSSSSRGS
jgi:hypothetical protein